MTALCTLLKVQVLLGEDSPPKHLFFFINSYLLRKIKECEGILRIKFVQNYRKKFLLVYNAGEIVFDKLLIEQLPKERVTYVVKGGPLVNDATMMDAKEVGMDQLVKVIDNGCDGQGTILPMCSPEFLDEFDKADLIISKGQANFETLNHLKDKPIYYLLKAKCLHIANVIQCQQGSSIIMK